MQGGSHNAGAGVGWDDRGSRKFWRLGYKAIGRYTCNNMQKRDPSIHYLTQLNTQNTNNYFLQMWFSRFQWYYHTMIWWYTCTFSVDHIKLQLLSWPWIYLRDPLLYIGSCKMIPDEWSWLSLWENGAIREPHQHFTRRRDSLAECNGRGSLRSWPLSAKVVTKYYQTCNNMQQRAPTTQRFGILPLIYDIIRLFIPPYFHNTLNRYTGTKNSHLKGENKNNTLLPRGAGFLYSPT